jgi:hypothetical protein
MSGRVAWRIELATVSKGCCEPDIETTPDADGTHTCMHAFTPALTRRTADAS